MGLDNNLEILKVWLLLICAGIEPHHGVEVVSELFAGATVDGQVEGAGEAHEGVDDEDNKVGHLVVQQLNGATGESVKHGDDHQRDLNHQEHRDDNDRHDGDPQGVSPSCFVQLLRLVPVGGIGCHGSSFLLSLGNSDQEQDVEDYQGDTWN